MLDVDKRRAKYYSFVTGQSWGKKQNYDLCISTANISIKETTPYIAQMLLGTIWTNERND
ncbi:cytidylate kinase family protein [Clostridium sp. FAM 1755]|uniref:cytidylate kinase family protein n=1 Tax=Clostridium caseinilyticum TaxID=3350403 RepID=UPI0038F6D276